MVAEVHPLKQGLKLSIPLVNTQIFSVAEVHPLKQGLKLDIAKKAGLDMTQVAEVHPLKQGLKLHDELLPSVAVMLQRYIH